MTVRIEVWPVAADAQSVWLVSGVDAWRTALPVPADGDPHAELELLLARHHLAPGTPEVGVIHSTSWRPDDTSVVLTYLAVIECAGEVRLHWPEAVPVSAELMRVVGPTPGHGAASPPTPRIIDVLFHGLRHLRFLVDTDATTRMALSGHWLRHLDTLSPALAGMYQ